MTIAIRVDASRDIGTGHVKRMLSLAKAIRALGGRVLFLWRDLGLDCRADLEEAGFEHVQLPHPALSFATQAEDPPHVRWAGVGSAQDIEDSVAALKGTAVNWLIVDHYAFDARWHDMARERLGCRICAIDDLADRLLAADIVVDHNHADDYRVKYRDIVGLSTRILGGPSFALLDSVYRDAQRYEFSPEVRSIGVFMGGVDSLNATSTVLDALQALRYDGAVEIVTTSANPHLTALDERVRSTNGTSLSCNLLDLSEFFARHDLQIGAGGGATWERCCIGAPTLLVIVAENQQNVAPQLSQKGIVALSKAADCASIAATLADLLENSDKRREFAVRSRQLVDGLGATRVAMELRCFV